MLLPYRLLMGNPSKISDGTVTSFFKKLHLATRELMADPKGATTGEILAAVCAAEPVCE